MKKSIITFVFALLSIHSVTYAQEAFVGEIRLFAGDFVPRGWAFCNGQLMSPNQNQALFAIIGTLYGGDGLQTFALPDLRGRVPIGVGNGQGLTPIVLGEKAGIESTSPNRSSVSTSIPLLASNQLANTSDPTNAVLAQPADNLKIYSTENPNVIMNPASIGSNPNANMIDNRQPVLGLHYIICIYGIFPSRD